MHAILHFPPRKNLRFSYSSAAHPNLAWLLQERLSWEPKPQKVCFLIAVHFASLLVCLFVGEIMTMLPETGTAQPTKVQCTVEAQ